MTPRLRLVLASLGAALLLAGCAGDDEGGPATTADAAAPPPPAATTPESVQTAVFERAYSECASTPLESLAAKYNAQRTRDAVSQAVAEAWRKQFGAGPDAVQDGKDGCLQGFDDA